MDGHLVDIVVSELHNMARRSYVDSNVVDVYHDTTHELIVTGDNSSADASHFTTQYPLKVSVTMTRGSESCYYYTSKITCMTSETDATDTSYTDAYAMIAPTNIELKLVG